MENITLYSIAAIALLGSFGHCIGMCGGIVLAYSSSKIDENFKKFKTLSAHLLYSLGRISVYVVFGAIFGWIGSVVVFDRHTAGTLYLVAGLFMVLAGLSLLGKIRFLNSVEHGISQSSFFKRAFRVLIASKNLSSFYLLGVLNGFLPCGFVYFFAVAAASSANALDGALIMLVFGLCTIPSLFLVGFFASSFVKSSFRAIALKIAAILVIGYGLFTLNSAYNFYTNPNASLTNCH